MGSNIGERRELGHLWRLTYGICHMEEGKAFIEYPIK
jgi:hypothetical protein